MTTRKKCRLCASSLSVTFANLGMYPLSNSYLTSEETDRMAQFYPLHAYVCGVCFLVQLEAFASPEAIFTDYHYASSYSESWLRHAKSYVDKVTERFGLGAKSQVIEVASNDGYLLQYFKEKRVPALGIEPAANVAKIAVEKGILTLTSFFGRTCAEDLVRKNIRADLLIGNNVYAHVPDLNDFTAGLKTLLSEDGVITLEFPHLLQLIQRNQFDTIYQEHFSYFSLLALERAFANHGLEVFDVEELPTHGGSLRIYGRHSGSQKHPVTPAVSALRIKEAQFGMGELKTYLQFEENVMKTKRKLLSFLIDAKNQGKQVVGYGAPAKGNTLLTYCGIRSDFLEFVVDRSPLKQGKFLPGTLIPILAPNEIDRVKPDYILILPWNLKEEIIEQMSHVRAWDCKFIIPIPELQVC